MNGEGEREKGSAVKFTIHFNHTQLHKNEPQTHTCRIIHIR